MSMDIGAPIDPAILEAVVGLNAFGINTEASCAGHLDHGNAHLWIEQALSIASLLRALIVEIDGYDLPLAL